MPGLETRVTVELELKSLGLGLGTGVETHESSHLLRSSEVLGSNADIGISKIQSFRFKLNNDFIEILVKFIQLESMNSNRPRMGFKHSVVRMCRIITRLSRLFWICVRLLSLHSPDVAA